MEIKYITEEQAERIIERWCDGKSEQGIYIAACKENDKYIAIDNSTNECWVEEFRTLKGCKKYLLEFWEYEEVLEWETKRFKRIEKALYIIYYLLIGIFILSSIFLMKKL
ncbi:hypothetical protein [Clostridium perfringens]|uniref:hypothetical protein n=1 Tax=Clostridium perfringens TaxID=1502 RepID=UPI0024BD5AD6|nr:hypothetical protein [Clostridium perfringens]MDU1966398.1 hypothetical protein [Clostridium perfringens]